MRPPWYRLPLLNQPYHPGTVYRGGLGLMGGFGARSCTRSSRKPEYSLILTRMDGATAVSGIAASMVG
jgi:hypothetical protein